MKMSQIMMLIVLTVLIVIDQCELSLKKCPNVKSSLGSIRKRRHLSFPDKSNFVLTISTVKAFMTHAPAGWNIALEIDVAFPLPDHNFTSSHLRRKLHHRQKREFWDKLKNGFDYHNLNGRACILRSVCEAHYYLAPPGQSLVHDLLRAVFTAPIDEQDFIDEVQSSYGELVDHEYCKDTMESTECPFSPLQFVLSLNKQVH